MHDRTPVDIYRVFQYRCRIEFVVLVFLSFLLFYWTVNANDFKLATPLETSKSPQESTHTVRRSDFIEFKIDINKADKAELTLLPRIGATIARRIIEYRLKNGNFEKVDDLLKVKGIGSKTLVQIRPYCQLSKSTSQSYGSDFNEAPSQEL